MVNVGVIEELPSATAVNRSEYVPGGTPSAWIGIRNSATCPGPTDFVAGDVTFAATEATRDVEIQSDP
jgi:hypothetical protein